MKHADVTIALGCVGGIVLLLSQITLEPNHPLHPLVTATHAARDKVRAAAAVTTEKAHTAAQAIHANAPSARELGAEIAANVRPTHPPANQNVQP